MLETCLELLSDLCDDAILGTLISDIFIVVRLQSEKEGQFKLFGK